MSELSVLRTFQESLNPEEKQILRQYKYFIMQGCVDITEADRRTFNLMLQSFMAGYRYRKQHEIYEQQARKNLGGSF
jgi:hypothetical protein